MPDLRIQNTEEMVGAGHGTKKDTLNRLMLGEHNNDGTHKSPLSNFTVQHNADGTHKNSVVIAHKNGVDQTGIVTATWTLITFSTEALDSNNNFASDTFTPTIASAFRIRAQITWTGMPVDKVIGIAVWLNGAEYRQKTQVVPTMDGWGVDIDCKVVMNGTTDNVKIYGYQASGGNEDIQGNPAKTWFEAERVFS